jgi:AGCS family alanine or glycine:cation symporter
MCTGVFIGLAASQKKAGVTEYTFDPEALGIKNADFWVRRKAKRDVR